MSAVRLRVGDTVPLSLQLESRETGRFPQAYMYDATDALLATKDLVHVAGGLYTHNAYAMPDEELVRVRYEVFTDAGHTTTSESDMPASATFTREDSAQPGDAMALTSQPSTQIEELWKLRGLDLANPSTHSPTGIVFAGITLAITTGPPGTYKVQRQ